MENATNNKARLTGVYIFLTIILILVLLNITLTIISAPIRSTNLTKIQEKTLPTEITKEVKEKMINDLITYWNQKDINKLYGFMGKTARTQLTLEKFSQQCQQLFSFGHISKPHYLSYEYKGKHIGADVFKIYYPAIVGPGNGVVTITILCSNGTWEVLGFDIKAQG